MELDYQKANIDLNIQQHLKGSSQKQSIEQSVHFIMATNIGWFISVVSLLAGTHQAISAISV